MLVIVCRFESCPGHNNSAEIQRSFFSKNRTLTSLLPPLMTAHRCVSAPAPAEARPLQKSSQNACKISGLSSTAPPPAAGARSIGQECNAGNGNDSTRNSRTDRKGKSGEPFRRHDTSSRRAAGQGPHRPTGLNPTDFCIYGEKVRIFAAEKPKIRHRQQQRYRSATGSNTSAERSREAEGTPAPAERTKKPRHRKSVRTAGTCEGVFPPQLLVFFRRYVDNYYYFYSKEKPKAYRKTMEKRRISICLGSSCFARGNSTRK